MCFYTWLLVFTLLQDNQLFPFIKEAFIGQVAGDKGGDGGGGQEHEGDHNLVFDGFYGGGPGQD